ncbi:FAD/FMN-containing dehydrogenase [Cribrihabitans marinus]|uniref:FAD/FMN-containing dehydrogenase n=1 Tax=Cribrihabitans marinus TaxID=1227549 RepID=A0A1H7AQV6_9RHOB|nr:FAD-binding oxidoreductase [Cribrihabitans marinus]GGH32222.1 D-2-hydroxyacid dehydrogenase [Cribrihabitans marinus]SEJ67326.1 FAD/FMN-containing dehydrogenase [Cribrihabitans marinus]
MPLNPADEIFAETLRAVLLEGVLRPVEPRYLSEPRGRLAGQAGLLALPRDVEDVSALVRAAAEARVPVVPYGGGTGLVGGQVMPDGPRPLVISLERMSAIRTVHPADNVLVAEAGAVLADVQAAARTAGRLFPLSLAAEGSARIGGTLATNAGGVNVLRYGNARDLCLGLEAVLPDGAIWHGLRRLRKDNTGYDLRNLLIGAEGTLGIITAAALKLCPVPAGQGTAMLVVSSPRAALDLLEMARDRLGEGISAFELIHGQGLEFLAETLPDLRQPFDMPPEWCVLVELGLAAGLDPAAALEDLFADALARGLVRDGVVAQSQAQRDELWSVREHIPEANKRIGAVSSHDISVPISAIPEFIRRGGELLARFGDIRINCFGHLGDGNLHYNVFPAAGRTRSDYDGLRWEVQRAVHDLVHDMGGSVSAEHGIGRIKVAELERYGDPAKLSAMRAIKAALDPAGIMNPGAVLRMNQDRLGVPSGP